MPCPVYEKLYGCLIHRQEIRNGSPRATMDKIITICPLQWGINGDSTSSQLSRSYYYRKVNFKCLCFEEVFIKYGCLKKDMLFAYRSLLGTVVCLTGSTVYTDWSINQRVAIIFTDESRFSLTTIFVYTFIWGACTPVSEKSTIMVEELWIGLMCMIAHPPCL